MHSFSVYASFLWQVQEKWFFHEKTLHQVFVTKSKSLKPLFKEEWVCTSTFRLRYWDKVIIQTIFQFWKNMTKIGSWMQQLVVIMPSLFGGQHPKGHLKGKSLNRIYLKNEWTSESHFVNAFTLLLPKKTSSTKKFWLKVKRQ